MTAKFAPVNIVPAPVLIAELDEMAAWRPDLDFAFALLRAQADAKPWQKGPKQSSELVECSQIEKDCRHAD